MSFCKLSLSSFLSVGRKSNIPPSTEQNNFLLRSFFFFFFCLTAVPTVGAKAHYIGQRTVLDESPPHHTKNPTNWAARLFYIKMLNTVFWPFSSPWLDHLYLGIFCPLQMETSWTVILGVIVLKGDLSAPSEALSSLDQGFIKCRSTLIHSTFWTSLSPSPRETPISTHGRCFH